MDLVERNGDVRSFHVPSVTGENLKEMLKDLSPDEIKDKLVEIVMTAERDADKLKALELLSKIAGLIKHGNQEKKEFREVIVGDAKEIKAGESQMTDE